MDLDTWTTFLVASLVTAFMPGQAILLAISNSLDYGISRALISSGGNVFGILLLAGATAVGLGMLVQQTPGALQAVKVLGALYLVYLGLQPWRNAGRVQVDGNSAPLVRPRTRLALFLQGVIVATSNPKGILFFCALFPQFARSGPGMAQRFVVMTCTFAACTVVAHGFFIMSAPWVSIRLGRHANAALGRKIGGALFIVLGLSMLRV
jgi:threonine/homoserine/homoserine lactone efflux protein